MNDEARARAATAVETFAREQGLEWEEGARPGEYVVVLPGERKLKTVCSILVGDRDVSVTAFVIRHPDENHEAFFRYLLLRNVKTPGLAYAVDKNDDVFVVGRLPLEATDDAQLDRLLGVVLEAADGAFNELLVLGFLTSMRREWAWRVARGESLRNLEAFRSILADTPPLDVSDEEPTDVADAAARATSRPGGALDAPGGDVTP